MFSAKHFATATPDQLASFEAARNAAASDVRTAQKTSQIAAKKGSLTLRCIFLGIQPPMAKGAGAAAAAGQGGGGGGGQAAEPPTRMTMMVLLHDVTKRQIPNAEYQIVSRDEILLPSRDSKARSAAGKLYKAAMATKATADIKKDPQEMAIADAGVERAKKALEDAETIITHMSVHHGAVYPIATFEHASAKALRAFQSVQVVGITSGCNYGKDGNLYTSLDCAGPAGQDSKFAPYVTLSHVLDLPQLPLRPYEPGANSERSQIVYFGNYMRTPDDVAKGRGPIVQRCIMNSTRRDDYKNVPQKGGEPTLRATWCLRQQQEYDTPGAPAGHYTMLAKFAEAKDWTPENQRTKNTLRIGFGINDVDTFAAVMAVNPVPCISLCSFDNKGVAGSNDIRAWANATHFMLREYLLSQCAQVSLDYVKTVFGVDPANPFIYLSRENPERPCQLNAASQTQIKGKPTLNLSGAILLNEFNGDLTSLMKNAPTPVQFRVMHSAMVAAVPGLPDIVVRSHIAELPADQAERVLAGDAKAPYKLETVPEFKMIYMVCSMSDEERAAYEAADNAWLTRREAAAAEEEQAMIDAADAAESAAAEAAASANDKRPREEEEGDAGDPAGVAKRPATDTWVLPPQTTVKPAIPDATDQDDQEEDDALAAAMLEGDDDE